MLQTPIDFPNQRPKTNFIRETAKCLVEKLQRVFYIGPKAALTRLRDASGGGIPVKNAEMREKACKANNLNTTMYF